MLQLVSRQELEFIRRIFVEFFRYIDIFEMEEKFSDRSRNERIEKVRFFVRLQNEEVQVLAMKKNFGH